VIDQVISGAAHFTPPQYIPYWSKRLSYLEALELALNLCGVVRYFAASEVLKKKG
jgi:hypothetical protein